MPHKLNHLLFTFAFWLMALTGFAQTFPVVINSQISQPTPIYWSNYADATTSNSPIKMQIVLNDLTIANRQVRLKCYWQGNGISFMNNDFVVGAQPLYLEGGVPLQLTNVNLAPYFEFQNMVGMTPNQYAQAIPEGIYSFSVEVYDVASGQKLSRKSTITAVIFQNEAPLLNLPLNNASIMQQNIQNIVFSWTPRQINVSNVEYQFDLVEIWDPYTPVQNAFAYSPPIFTTTTRATTLQYSIAEPQLIPGKRYAWRIKAKALAGAEEIGVFKNNGFSEIFAFTYEVFCTPPVQIATDGISQDQAKVTWTGALDNFDYQVKYREKNADSQWYTAVTPREFAKLVNLKPNTTYEYTVGAACDKGKYVHSSPQEFTTLAKDEIAFAGCGIKPDPKDLTNQNPLPNLLPDDVVTAGDFPIVVIKSSGSNGRFTGEGYVTLPFLEKFRKLIDAADALGGEKVNIGKFSRIRITFNNIGVNTDFKLISGEIVASYDPEWKSMIDGDKLVEDIKDLFEEYDPIIASIFGPKPVPEPETAEPDDEDETNDSNAATTATGTTQSVIVESTASSTPDEPEKEEIVAPVANTTYTATAPSTGTAKENAYYIEYLGKKYYTGGKINIPYARNMMPTFEMKTVPADAKVTYSIYEPGKQEMWRGYDSSSAKSSLPIEDSKVANNLLKQDLQAEATSIEGNPKVKVLVEKVVTPFTQNKLTVTDIKNTKRFASAGKTLYFINKPLKTDYKEIKLEATLSQTDDNKIPKGNIKWKINDIENEYKEGDTEFKIPITDKIENATFTNSAGFPTMTDKTVSVKWVDEHYYKNTFSLSSNNFKNPLIKKTFEATKLVEKSIIFLDKIPFIKRVQNKGLLKSGSINYFYNIIPFQEEFKRKEDLNSRLYYDETKTSGGFELGIEGKATVWKWGLPFETLPLPQWTIDKIKKVVTAEVNIIASASASGEMKAVNETRLFAESSKIKTIKNGIDPAILKLDVTFGVESEFSIGGDNDYLSGGINASGISKAELFRIGYYDDVKDFRYVLLKEGVYLELKASGFINTLGKKWETERYYKKIELIKGE